MWTTVIPKVALCLSLLAPTGHARSDHVQKGDPFAICLNKNTHSIASNAKLSCDAGSEPAYFQGMKKKGSQNIELQFQSNPNNGGHSYNLEVRCPASQTVTQTVTVSGSASTATKTSTSTITSTTTSTMTSTSTKKDCTITAGPSPTPDNGSLCTIGRAACVNTRENFTSRMGCDEGYQAKGCVCYDSENMRSHRPRCNGAGQVVCTGCN